MATPARAFLFAALVAIALAALAAFLVNVPPVAIGGGVGVGLITTLVLLSRHGTGKRSGSAADRENSRAQ